VHVGVDFDNTIVRYDSLFHRACFEKGLIPESVPKIKAEVRSYLCRIGREDTWTEMQGEVYGRRMSEAEPFPGVIEFFRACREAGVKLSIISHKTRYPYAGERYDFHEAALRWLEENRFFDPSQIGLSRDQVYFELSKADKIARIAAAGCDLYIDDLPEILSDPTFPQAVQRVLFDPAEVAPANLPYKRAGSWAELTAAYARPAVG